MRLAAREVPSLSVHCEVGGRKVEALLFTGASHSFVSAQLANSLFRGLPLDENDGPCEFTTADGNRIRSAWSIRVGLKMFRFSWRFVLVVVPGLCQEVIFCPTPKQS